MAQDPEREDEEREQEDIDTSHDLDMVPLFSSQTIDAEVEADIIHGILEANGVPSLITGPLGQYPNLGIDIKVPQNRLEEARRLIDEARAAGPEAAAEAEAASEERQS
jgi:hypothetical protein